MSLIIPLCKVPTYPQKLRKPLRLVTNFLSSKMENERKFERPISHFFLVCACIVCNSL